MNQLGSWISSIGTLIAIATSLYLLRQGQQDRRQVRADTKRQQASLVTCWADWKWDSPNATLGHPSIPTLYVRNSSEQVVYDAFVDYRSPVDDALVRKAFGPIPPGDTQHRELTEHPPHDPRWDPSGMYPRLFFQDATGVRWHRSHRGRLMEDPGSGNDDFAREPDSRFAN